MNFTILILSNSKVHRRQNGEHYCTTRYPHSQACRALRVLCSSSSQESPTSTSYIVRIPAELFRMIGAEIDDASHTCRVCRLVSRQWSHLFLPYAFEHIIVKFRADPGKSVRDFYAFLSQRRDIARPIRCVRIKRSLTVGPHTPPLLNDTQQSEDFGDILRDILCCLPRRKHLLYPGTMPPWKDGDLRAVSRTTAPFPRLHLLQIRHDGSLLTESSRIAAAVSSILACGLSAFQSIDILHIPNLARPLYKGKRLVHGHGDAVGDLSHPARENCPVNSLRIPICILAYLRLDACHYWLECLQSLVLKFTGHRPNLRSPTSIENSRIEPLLRSMRHLEVFDASALRGSCKAQSQDQRRWERKLPFCTQTRDLLLII